MTQLPSPLPVRAPFGLATPHKDADLAGLFALLRVSTAPLVRIQISQIAGRRLHELYPLGCGTVGTIHLINGLTFNVDLGDQFGAHFYFGHLNEAAFLSALCATLPVGARTVDVGGNFGLYAVHAAAVSGPEGRVVAFEPLPSALALLGRNCTENALGNRVVIRPEAVSAETGTALFHAAIEGAFSGLHDTGRSPIGHAFETQTVRLDDSPDVAALGAVDFLKIDTEGHEAGVLKGAQSVIAQSPEILISLEYSHKNLTDTARADVLQEIDLLLARGFQAWVLDDDANVSTLHSVDQISIRLSGTIVLAAPGCAWADDLIAAFKQQTPWFNIADALNGVERIVGQLRMLEVERANLEAVLSRTEFIDDSVPIYRRVKMLINTSTRQIRKLEKLGERDASPNNDDTPAEDTEARLEKKNGQLRTMLEATQARNAALADRNAHLEREYEALNQQIQSDRKENADRAEADEPLRQQLDAMTRESADLRKAMEAARTLQQAQQSEIATLKRALAKRDDRIAKAEQDVIEARGLVHSLEKRLAARKSFYDALEAEFAAFRAQTAQKSDG